MAEQVTNIKGARRDRNGRLHVPCSKCKKMCLYGAHCSCGTPPRSNPNEFTPKGPSFSIAPKGPRGPHGDDPDAEDLILYAQNTYELYGQEQSIQKNLLRKIAARRYDYRQAPKLWGYWVESAAKRYVREMPDGTGRPWNVVFQPIIRQQAAIALAREFESKARDGLFSGFPEQAKALDALKGKKGKKSNPGRLDYQGQGRQWIKSFRDLRIGPPAATGKTGPGWQIERTRRFNPRFDDGQGWANSFHKAGGASLCKRCKGAGAVKLGPRMVPCPTCCRKKNPVSLERGALALARVGRAKGGVGADLANVIESSVSEKKHRNPLDSHKPGCRCFYHKKLRGEK